MSKLQRRVITEQRMVGLRSRVQGLDVTPTKNEAPAEKLVDLLPGGNSEFEQRRLDQKELLALRAENALLRARLDEAHRKDTESFARGVQVGNRQRALPSIIS